MASRRDRLHDLMDLARSYRGWTRAHLARTLSRDTTSLYGETEDPRLSLLIGLADTLDWPLESVSVYLWTGFEEEIVELAPEAPANRTFAELYRYGQESYHNGAYNETLAVAGHLHKRAETPEETAKACNVEFLGWDGLGRFTRASAAINQALLETDLPTNLRLGLQSNLANAHYTLWDLTSARGVASGIIEWFDHDPPKSLRPRMTEAFAHYVRGNALRRLMRGESVHAKYFAKRARADLKKSIRLYEQLATDFPDGLGIANTCRAGCIEVDVELELVTPAEAIETLSESLNSVTDLTTCEQGNWLESFGWSCIFAGNICLRYCDGAELSRQMAIFLNKALEIGEHMDNWSFRERVLSMEHLVRKKVCESTGFTFPTLIDDEDRRLITGALGRFPAFRSIGLEILRNAQVVHGKKK